MSQNRKGKNEKIETKREENTANSTSRRSIIRDHFHLTYFHLTYRSVRWHTCDCSGEVDWENEYTKRINSEICFFRGRWRELIQTERLKKKREREHKDCLSRTSSSWRNSTVPHKGMRPNITWHIHTDREKTETCSWNLEYAESKASMHEVQPACS